MKDVNNNVSNNIIWLALANSFFKIWLLLFHIWVLTAYAVQTCMNISKPNYRILFRVTGDNSTHWNTPWPLIHNIDPLYKPDHVRHSEIHTWDTSLWKTLAIALRTYTASFPLTPPSPGHFSSYISFVPHSRLILLSLLFLVYDFYVF